MTGFWRLGYIGNDIDKLTIVAKLPAGSKTTPKLLGMSAHLLWPTLQQHHPGGLRP